MPVAVAMAIERQTVAGMLSSVLTAHYYYEISYTRCNKKEKNKQTNKSRSDFVQTLNFGDNCCLLPEDLPTEISINLNFILDRITNTFAQ